MVMVRSIRVLVNSLLPMVLVCALSYPPWLKVYVRHGPRSSCAVAQGTLSDLSLTGLSLSSLLPTVAEGLRAPWPNL